MADLTGKPVGPESGLSSSGGPPSRPRRSELPWYRRPWILIPVALLLLGSVTRDIVRIYQSGHHHLWLMVLGGFLAGAIIGMIGVPAMTRLRGASWLLEKSRGACYWPAPLSLNWRALQQFYRKPGQAGKDVFLIALVWLLAMCVGILPTSLYEDLPVTFGFDVLFGWMLTLLFLPIYLWWRSLPE